MELWIRSQDKDILLKADSLLIDDNNNDIYTQCWVGVNLETYTLGKYKTKERALEVLDEIQNILLLKDMYANDKEEIMKGWEKFSDEEIKLMRKKMVVYEMPEE